MSCPWALQSACSCFERSGRWRGTAEQEQVSRRSPSFLQANHVSRFNDEAKS